MSAAMPVREEGAAARALRALRVSGRRLAPRRDGWAVMERDARRRPLLVLREGEALALVAAGLVIATEGGGYVLSDEARSAHAPVCYVSGPYASAGVGQMLAHPAAQATAARRADFSGLVVLARSGEVPLSLRGALAGLRIARDAESASRRDGLGMNWSATPMERRRRSGASRGGLSESAREASLRLERVAAALPAPGFPMVRAACVDGRKLSALEAAFALKPRSAGVVLARLLEVAADALDRGG